MLYDARWKKHRDKQDEDWRNILLDAADLIEKKGWTQRRTHDKNGYCIRGAIDRVSKDRLYQRFLAKHKLQNKIWRPTIVGWNDTKSRTKGQVLFVLRLVASQ